MVSSVKPRREQIKRMIKRKLGEKFIQEYKQMKKSNNYEVGIKPKEFCVEIKYFKKCKLKQG